MLQVGTLRELAKLIGEPTSGEKRDLIGRITRRKLPLPPPSEHVEGAEKYANMQIKHLKQECRNRGLKTSGNKKLLQRLVKSDQGLKGMSQLEARRKRILQPTEAGGWNSAGHQCSLQGHLQRCRQLQ